MKKVALTLNSSISGLSLKQGALFFNKTILSPKGVESLKSPQFIPIRDIHSITVMSNYRATFSTPLLMVLLENGISVIFSSPKGEWKGMLSPFGMTSQVKRRSLQEEILHDYPFRYKISSFLMEAKFSNTATYLSLLSKRKKEKSKEVLKSASQEIKNLKSLLKKPKEESLSFLLGLEGKVANIYWGALRESEVLPSFFKGRKKHNQAKDVVNLALNYTYTLLLRDIAQVLSSSALDPALGFYHEPYRNRPSLICDIMEDLRAWLVDRLIFKNLSHLKKEGDFLSEETTKYLREMWREETLSLIPYFEEKKTLENLLFRKVHSLIKAYHHRDSSLYETTFFKKW